MLHTWKNVPYVGHKLGKMRQTLENAAGQTQGKCTTLGKKRNTWKNAAQLKRSRYLEKRTTLGKMRQTLKNGPH